MRFLGRPGRDNFLSKAMRDVHLVAACAALGIPVTKKQVSKWLRKEGAAYKYAQGIADHNIKDKALANLPKAS